jgi:DNA mismatch repair protein MSH4
MSGIEEGEEALQERSKTIVSIAENRARELCLCVMNTGLIASLEVYVVPDNHTYKETLGTLALIHPDEILLHDGTKDAVLSTKIKGMFEANSGGELNVAARIVYVTRSLFDQDRGAELLKKIVSGINTVDADLMAKYTVLAASFCLLRYVETVQGMTFCENSVKLNFLSGQQNRVSIDRRTVTALEIIGNVRDGNQEDSLLGAINRTKTKIGERLLRSNLLRPIFELPTLDTRLDTVEFLMRNAHLQNSIIGSLCQLPDLDSMLAGLSMVSKKVSTRSTKKGIDTLIMLKSVINHAEDLARMLREGIEHAQEGTNNVNTERINCSQDLLHAVINTLSDPSMVVVKDAIDNLIDDSICYKKDSYAMRQQECFAIKDGVSQILQVARGMYTTSVAGIDEVSASYEASLSVPVQVGFSPNRGYFLQIHADVQQLPEEVIQPVQGKKWISCTTSTVSDLSRKALESAANCLNITSDLLQEVMQIARENSEALFSLADGVALLDMLSGFATVIMASKEPFCRPSLSTTGPIVVSKARHPISCTSAKARGASLSRDYIPNDISISEEICFEVITGPNGSGKTHYIKQVALVVVMAQIGMFVPAIHCKINIRDRILTRMGNAESIEHGVSSFDGEMREAAYILNNATKSSLVEIDELGKSTSIIDGIALAFAVAEKLVSIGAFTLFVTHFPQLTMLEDMYPSVCNLHLATDIEDKIRFLHTISNGACEIRFGYGVAMAEICGFSPQFISRAKEKMTEVRDAFPLLLKAEKVDHHLVAATTLSKNLQSLASSSMNETALHNFKIQLRGRIPQTTQHEILNLLDHLDKGRIEDITNDHHDKADAPGPNHLIEQLSPTGHDQGEIDDPEEDSVCREAPERPEKIKSKGGRSSKSHVDHSIRKIVEAHNNK